MTRPDVITRPGQLPRAHLRWIIFRSAGHANAALRHPRNEKLSADIHFPQVTHCLLPHAPREAVNEQLAIQVIHLMLDAACQQALALDHDGLAQPIDAPDPGVQGPPDRIPQPREGEASLILFLLTLDSLNHGVHNMPDPAIDVIGKDAAAYSDLVGGQARTTRRGDGLFEVGHQADERPTELVNGIAAGTKHWITDQADGTLGHCAILPQQLTTSSPAPTPYSTEVQQRPRTAASSDNRQHAQPKKASHSVPRHVGAI
jgi:hypothetical protein